MTFNLSFGSTDKYSPFAQLGNYFLSGSPQSLKAQEVALTAIAAELRDWMADYDQNTQHIKAAYPAGAGAVAAIETAHQIYTGMGTTTRTLSGEDGSLSAVLGRAAHDLASGQDTATWIKQATDATVTALENSTWFAYLAPVAAYAGTILQFLPAVSQLASMYNNVATLVDNLDPDEGSSTMVASTPGTVGQGYQAGTGGFMNTGNDPNGQYSPYGANGYGANGQYPANGTTQASPWMDSTGQWHYPTTGTGTGATSPYTSAMPSGSSGSMPSGSTGAMPGSAGTTPASYPAPEMPDLGSSSTLADGWVPVDSGTASSTGTGSTGGGSGTGAADTGSSGTGSSGGGSAGAAPTSGSGDGGGSLAGGGGSTDSGTSTSTDTGAPSSHHDSSGVTITISEGDASMTVTTDRDGHFEGSMNGHDVDIDVDLVDA